MEFLIKKSEFAKGLGIAQAVADSKRAMPILSNVLISTSDQGIDLIATDLDLGIRASFPAEVKAAGKMAVSARKLYDIVRELPAEEVHVSEEEERRMLVASGQSSFRLPGMDVEEFPPLPDYVEEDLLSFEAAEFADLIRKVIYAASSDATRIALNGALFECDGKVLHFAATDGHRLAYVRKALSEKAAAKVNALLPRKALAELARLLAEGEEPLRMALQKNHAIFLRANIVLITRLLDGQFPNYQEVIPKQTTSRIVIDRASFSNALRRVALLANEKSHLVKFDVKANSLLLSSTDLEQGEAKEEIPMQYDGEEFTAAFNARFFAEAVNVVEGDNVYLNLSGALGPCLITPENSDDYKGVIMPMRT